MKRTKMIARLLTLALVLCMVLIPLVSCANIQEIFSEVKEKVEEGIEYIQDKIDESGEDDDEQKTTCTLVVATDPETVYTVDLSKVGEIEEGLVTVLDYLKENDGLTYEKTESETTGAYLTKILTLDPATVTEGYGYLQLFTSVEKDFDVSQYATEMTYNDTKLVSSGYGASSMTIQAGAVYYITLAVF